MKTAVILRISALLLFLSGCDSESPSLNTKTVNLDMFPQNISPACRDGRAKLYDECGDQLELFREALSYANNKGKILLVSYGAEWCIWCHVFKAYVHGETDRFTYTYGDPESDATWTDTLREKSKRNITGEAEALANFVSENFVIVHIEYRYSMNGDQVVSQANAWDGYEYNIPYIFSVDAGGVFAASFRHEDVGIRRDGFDWFRGYDRQRLLLELQRLHSAARRG